MSFLKTKANTAEVLIEGLNQKTDNQSTRLESLNNTLTMILNYSRDEKKKIEPLKGKN